MSRDETVLCYRNERQNPMHKWKLSPQINHLISLLPNFLMNFWCASEKRNQNAQTRKGTLKGDELSLHSVSDSLFLSRATGVPGDSFNIHSNHGERDPVWEILSGVQRGTLILAQITAAGPARICWLLSPSGQVSLQGGVLLTSKLSQATDTRGRVFEWAREPGIECYRLSVSPLAGDGAHRKGTSKGSHVSLCFSLIVKLKEGRKPNTTIDFSLCRCVFSLFGNYNKMLVWNS